MRIDLFPGGRNVAGRIKSLRVSRTLSLACPNIYVNGVDINGVDTYVHRN
ncbi:hypothetical protein ACQP25_33330 [Microtetraspora malaysiensis]